jgi:transposase
MNNDAEPNEVPNVYLGIDVAKATFDAALVLGTDAGCGRRPAELPVKTFPRSPHGAQDLVAWVGSTTGKALEENDHCLAVMEATGMFSTELAAWLVEASSQVKPAIVNPRDAAHHRKSLGLRNNTDKLAARALALFGLERRPQPYEALTQERAELRAMSRYRDHLVQQRTAMKNRLKENAISKWVRKREEAQLKQLDKEILRVEKKLREHVQQHEELARDVKLLISMPGVGFLTAVVLLAEVGNLRNFNRARPLTAYVGLSPEHHESGTSVRGRTHMSKKGNRRARQALYLAALTTVRYPGSLSEMYQRLLSRGRPAKAALGAVMRKMLTILRAMCITDSTFEPKGPACGKSGGKPGEELQAVA